MTNSCEQIIAYLYEPDVSPEMGSLGIVPASHLQFQKGMGHGDVSTGPRNYEHMCACNPS